MASITPVKAYRVPEEQISGNTCICCNLVIEQKNHPVSLSSELRERVNTFIFARKNQAFDQLSYPKKICRPCKRSLESAEKFQKLVQKSYDEQTAKLQEGISRNKRLSKEEDSPSAQAQRIIKRSTSEKTLLPSRSAKSLFKTITPYPAATSLNTKWKNDHDLCTSGIRDTKFLECDKTPVNVSAIQKIVHACSSTTHTPFSLAVIILSIPELDTAIKKIYLERVDSQCKSLCLKTKGKPSVLRAGGASFNSLVKFRWETVLAELREKAPDVFNVLVAIGIPTAPKTFESGTSMSAPLCAAWGILMNLRNNQLSLIQKVVAVILGIGGCTKQTFKRLNFLKISQSHQSWLGILNELGDNLMTVIKGHIAKGLQPRITWDNFDFRISSTLLQKGVRTKDNHWICQYMTFDRVDSTGLDDSKPMGDLKEFELVNYFLNQNEQQQMRYEVMVLVARAIIPFIPCLQPISDAIPNHIEHQYSEQMSQKSVIIGLPVVPYNQSKHADVVKYLDHVQGVQVQMYGENDEPPDDLPKIPLGGDLLGRERATGAKKLRSGCDAPIERFSNIIEVAEYWHAKQAFLSLCWEKLYSTQSGRDIGTLFYFRNTLGRRNVKKKVKDGYTQAEDLFLQVSTGYLVAAFLQWACMDGINGQPKDCYKPPDKRSSKEAKVAYFTRIFGAFVDDYCLLEGDIEKAIRQQHIQREEQRRQKNQQESNPDHESHAHVTSAEEPQENKDDIKPDQLVNKETPQEDRVKNYGLWVIRLGVVLMQLNDTEREGDGERSIRNAKLLMLLFRACVHSKKYAFEFFRLVSKVRCQYSEKLAHRVIHGRFVNWKGGIGNNCANDLKQEHLVKFNKKLLRGMGAQKTEKAVTRSTSAACGLKKVIENYDLASNIAPDSSSHTYKSAERDQNEIIATLLDLKPFNNTLGRQHNHFPNIPNSPLDLVDICLLEKWMNMHRRKLAKDPEAEVEGESDDDDESEWEDTDDGGESDSDADDI